VWGIKAIIIFALLFKGVVVKNRDYIIPFEGLKVGDHQFSFELDKAFFSSFENSEIEQSDLQVTVDLIKKENMLQFDTVLIGSVDDTCDRCGSPCQITLEADFRLVVKFGAESQEQDMDVLILGPGEHEIDLSTYLFEYAHVSLPLKRVHEDEEDCNQEALDALDEFSYRHEDEEETDPRWDALKNLKKD